MVLFGVHANAAQDVVVTCTHGATIGDKKANHEVYVVDVDGTTYFGHFGQVLYIAELIL